MLLSEKGIGPTAERVRAVVEAREPENASEVRSFLGLAGLAAVSYLNSQVSRNLCADWRRRMPNLILGLSKRKRSTFSKISWLKPQQLAYFDKDAPTKVIADAGPKGIGAVLVQDQRGGMVLSAMWVGAWQNVNRDIRKQSVKHLRWCGHVNDCTHTCMVGSLIWSQTTRH